MLRPVADPNSPTLSVPQAARYLGISEWLAYEAVRRGEIPSRRIGGRILVPRTLLVAWLEGQEVQPHGTLRRLRGTA